LKMKPKVKNTQNHLIFEAKIYCHHVFSLLLSY
jgi:hypothetical protein